MSQSMAVIARCFAVTVAVSLQDFTLSFSCKSLLPYLSNMLDL